LGYSYKKRSKATTWVTTTSQTCIASHSVALHCNDTCFPCQMSLLGRENNEPMRVICIDIEIVNELEMCDDGKISLFPTLSNGRIIQMAISTPDDSMMICLQGQSGSESPHESSEAKRFSKSKTRVVWASDSKHMLEQLLAFYERLTIRPQYRILRLMDDEFLRRDIHIHHMEKQFHWYMNLKRFEPIVVGRGLGKSLGHA